MSMQAPIAPVETKVTDWSRYKKVKLETSKLIAGTILTAPWEPVFLEGKAPFKMEWNKSAITTESLNADYAGYKPRITGVGLRTGKLAGVDVDCTDDGLTEWINGVMVACLGKGALYRHGSKGYMALHWNQTPIGKMTLVFSKDGKSHKIEVLGRGQQMAAFGAVAADAKKGTAAFDYIWLDGESPINVPHFELPEVTPDMLRSFLEKISEGLMANGYDVGSVGSIDGGNGPEKSKSSGTGGLVDMPMLEKFLNHIDPGKDHNEGLPVVAALKYAEEVGLVCDSDSLELDENFSARDIAINWSRGDYWQDGMPANYAEGWAEKRYDSLDGITECGTTFATIVKLAIDGGYKGATRIDSPYQSANLLELFGIQDKGDSIPPKGFKSWADFRNSIVNIPARDTDLPELKEANEPRFKIYAENEGMEGPPLDMVIDGLLAMGYQTLFYGDEQTLKTYIVLEMMLCAITGKKFLPIPGKPDSGFAVLKEGLTGLYICGEGFEGIKKQKVPLWKKHHGISPDTVLPFYSMDAMPSMLDDNAVKDLADCIKAKFAVQGDPLPDMIAIDTLVYAIAPDGKEDSNDDATKMYRAGKLLGKLLGKPIIVMWIHHKGHVAVRARGASNITTSSDVRFRVEHVTDPRYTGDKEHPTSRSYHVKLLCEKFKDTTLPQPVEFKGSTVFDNNANGCAISSVLLEGTQSASEHMADQRAKESAADELRDLVASMFQMKGVTKASVNQMAGWCSEQVKGAPSGSWLDPEASTGKRHFSDQIPLVFNQPYQTSDGLHWVSMVGSLGRQGGGQSVIMTAAT